MEPDLFGNMSHMGPPKPTQDDKWKRSGPEISEPEGTELQVRFPCFKCDGHVYSNDFFVPGLNWMAEKARDMPITEEIEAYCESCNTIYDLYVQSGVGGAEIQSFSYDLDDIDLEYRVLQEATPYDMDPDPFDFEYEEFADAVASNTKFYDTFRDGIQRVQSIAVQAPINEADAEALARMLYAHVITLVETYLSDAFINTVINDKKLIRRAVEKLPFFKEQQFPLSAIYAKMEAIKNDLRQYLLHVLYHDLKRVGMMYQVILGIKLPEAEDLRAAISTRHDIVHRNGWTKEGDPVNVNIDSVHKLVGIAELFVQELDNRLGNFDDEET